MIFMPPRHGKSELASVRLPAWYIGQHPEREIICASYAAKLAVDFGRQVRNIIASPEYGVLFDTELAQDSEARDRWNTNKGGGYVAAGIGGGITGHGAHLLSIDDPVKDRADAESETMREAVWNWYRSVAYPRLMPNAAIVLTMTRWQEDDLAGRLLNQMADGGEQWDVLSLPAINADGTALWSESYPRPVLDQIRSVIGEYDWSALYQQQPRPPGGGFFLEQNLLGSDGHPVPWPKHAASVFATLDTATKTGKDADGSAVCFWAYENLPTEQPLHLLDWGIVQIDGDLLITWLPTIFNRLEEMAIACRARMGSLGAYIEDKASGMILLQQAQRQNLPVQPIDSKLTSVGKVERAINISGYVSRKMVMITAPAHERIASFKGATKNHLMTQILGFHVGTKDMGQDDLLDCFTYGCALALGNGEGF